MKREHLLLAALLLGLALVGGLLVVLNSHGSGERREKPAEPRAEKEERSPQEVDDHGTARPSPLEAAAQTKDKDQRANAASSAPARASRKADSAQTAGSSDSPSIGIEPVADTEPRQEEEEDKPAPTTNNATIEGRVLNDSGEPVPGASVTAAATADAALLSTSSGSSGRFLFEQVAPGSWLLTARKDQADASAGPVVVADDASAQVTIYLGVVSCLAGNVLDAETRGPVADVRLQAYDAQRKRAAPAFSDAEGRFHVNVPAPGTYRLYVPRGQKHLESQSGFTVELAAGECRKDLVFFVREGISLAGTVFKGEGPVAGAHIELVDLFNDQGGNKGETVSDGQGHFSFIGQKPGGNYTARAIHPDHGMGESEPVLTGPGGALGKLDVHLQPGRTVGGRLLTHLGRGVPDIEVWVIRNRGQPWRPMPGTRAVSAADGSFSVDNVPPGEYQFVVTTAETTRLISEHFSVLEGEEPERLDINLGEGVEGFIEGQVTSPDGEPLRSVEVIAHPQAPRMVAGTDTDSDGRYRLDGLGPAPKHTVWARGFRLGRVRKPLHDVPINSSNVDFVLGKMSTISGKVIEAATGEPVTGFHVNGPLVDRDFESPDGSFTIDDLQMTHGEFIFTSPGYASAIYDPGEVKEGEVIEGIVIEMKSGTWLEGTVTSTAGAPVQGARVKLMLQGEKDLHDLYREYNWKASDPYTDAQGRFFLQGNPKGQTNSFVVWHPDFPPTVISNTHEKKFDIVLTTEGK
jgi:hypothetical protein